MSEAPKMQPVYTVYLLHFSRPVSGKQHYIGITASHRLDARLEEHARGNGARLTRRVFLSDERLALARTWKVQDRAFEKQIKRQGHAKQLCPICTTKDQYPHLDCPRLLTKYPVPAPGHSLTNWTDRPARFFPSNKKAARRLR